GVNSQLLMVADTVGLPLLKSTVMKEAVSPPAELLWAAKRPAWLTLEGNPCIQLSGPGGLLFCTVSHPFDQRVEMSSNPSLNACACMVLERKINVPQSNIIF